MRSTKTNAIPTRLYYVEIRTVFDHPERRGSGYLHTPAAHSTHSDRISKASRAAHEAAFALVDPSSRPGADWKARIAALVTDTQLAAAGVTIDQVNAAIEFYTATKPTTTREKIAPTGEPGYLVLADGYRAGPAGDY